MSRRFRHQVGQLGRVAVVRALQSEAAAVMAGQAAAASQTAEEVAEKEAVLLDHAAEGWREALNSTGLTDGTAPLWAAELLRQQDVLVAARQAASEAGEEARHRKDEWAGCIQRQDAADDMLGNAERRLTRWRDEASLTDAMDRGLWLWRDR